MPSRLVRLPHSQTPRNIMTKQILALLFCLASTAVSAQQTFTTVLQHKADSAGQIVLHQDKAISDLVDGTARTASGITESVRNAVHAGDSIVSDSIALAQKVKKIGYRIQVYFGDNSRQGKSGARTAGQRFKNFFPDVPVYVSFVSPQWFCRVGDFQSNEEALELLHQMREMGVFQDAVIVKSKINVRL